MKLISLALILSSALASSETSYPSYILAPELHWDNISELGASLHDFEASEFDFDNYLMDVPSAFETGVLDHHFPLGVDTVESLQIETPLLQEYTEDVKPRTVLRPRRRTLVMPDNMTPCCAETEALRSLNCASSSNSPPLINSEVTTTLAEVSSSSSSSVSSDHSSYSDCHREQDSRIKSKRKRVYSTSKRVYSKRRVQHYNEDELAENKRKMIENETLDMAIAKRTTFSHRAPFLYKTICDCKNRYFAYISFAIRHLIQIHGYQKDGYNENINRVDDFNVIKRYPFKCYLCPFRSNLQYYLDNHIEHCHENK